MEFDIEEAIALCGIFGVTLGLQGAHLYRLDYHWGKYARNYDWAYLKTLDRELWYEAVADLLKQDLISPAHEKWVIHRTTSHGRVQKARRETGKEGPAEE